MQRRTEVTRNLASRDAPGRIAIADEMRAQNELVSVRDAVRAGGIRRFTVKEMFGE